MIKEKRTYTVPNCSITATVVKIHHISDEFIKVKLILKINDRIMEMKNYKLRVKAVEQWIEVKV